MSEASKTHRFEQLMLPHLDAAFNLARWLTRNPSDAEDVVQESYLRAFKFFDSFHGGNSRAWLLTIVRNTCLSWLHANRTGEVTALADLAPDDAAEAGWVDAHALAGAAPDDPEQLLLQAEARKCLNDLIESLPVAFREVMVLRELEDLSYKDIAAIAGIPLGTVMSRLARARRLLLRAWSEQQHKEADHGV